MSLERYSSYGPPRIGRWNGGLYMIRDVLTEDDKFSGVCEYAKGFDDEGVLQWGICREGVEYSEIKPFLPATALKGVPEDKS